MQPKHIRSNYSTVNRPARLHPAKSICIFGQCANIFSIPFYPSATGVFYISKTSVHSQNLGMRSTLTPHPKSNLPKFLSKYLSHPPLPSQNCTKFSHNSQIDFDNHFDAPTKYPLTNTTNKLSDNYKTSQNLPNSLESTENITLIPTLIPTFIPNFSPYSPLKYISTTLYPTPPHLICSIPNHTSKHHFITELIPPLPKISIKIRPESTDPSLKSYFTTFKDPHY